MNGVEHLPPWAAVLTAVLVFTGASVTLIGSLGLLRLGTFYERVHAPTLGSTLGTVFIAAASMVCFSVLESRAALHEILIVVLGTVTTPIALTVLVGAARFRDTAERAQLGEPAGRAPPHGRVPGDAPTGKAG